ncbi:MAG: tRNA (adenosine(37)-N6)-threonylcarbamoyltransferase complex ATPase subunit type 1 TsaE [Acidobacteria bacterium]|nr:MAG: tRNA (adenosine(37)-N6)-threonylcarbamoyltransferase complex ATPase subunit type 1 TsaE [Acidobacteriota bacterium]
MKRWTTDSEEQTRALGASFGDRLAPDGVLLLAGDLGAGKTVLTQGVAAGLGIDPREVVSPSFTLIREHEGSAGILVHVDLYRLEPEDVSSLALDELLAGPGIKVVEWAERLPFAVPGAVCLELRRTGREDQRQISEIECGSIVAK